MEVKAIALSPFYSLFSAIKKASRIGFEENNNLGGLYTDFVTRKTRIPSKKI